ncbi:hypothetical protein IOCL1545_000461000, partial [Leishmania shawi]
MSDEDHDFSHQGGGDNASKTYPLAAGALKKGGYVCINGRPCKVIDLSVSKTGKHGHAKVSIVATDIFTGNRLEDQAPSTHNVKSRSFPSNTMSDEDHDFSHQGGGDNASKTYPLAAGALKKGGYVCINGRPCKVIDLSVSKTGKHGHAKVSIVATDIFTGNRLEDQAPSTHNV